MKHRLYMFINVSMMSVYRCIVVMIDVSMIMMSNVLVISMCQVNQSMYRIDVPMISMGRFYGCVDAIISMHIIDTEVESHGRRGNFRGHSNIFLKS